MPYESFLEQDYMDYEADGADSSNHTLYCPNPECERHCWGVYLAYERDTNASYVSPESDENCPECGWLGADEDPHKGESP